MGFLGDTKLPIPENKTCQKGHRRFEFKQCIVQNEKKPCLICMAQELLYYHGCMQSVCQVMGQERGCRIRNSFRMNQVDR